MRVYYNRRFEFIYYSLTVVSSQKRENCFKSMIIMNSVDKLLKKRICLSFSYPNLKVHNLQLNIYKCHWCKNLILSLTIVNKSCLHVVCVVLSCVAIVCFVWLVVILLSLFMELLLLLFVVVVAIVIMISLLLLFVLLSLWIPLVPLHCSDSFFRICN